MEWVQKRPGPKGKPVPKGFTCYRCYDTRRRVFKEFDSMKECQDARDKDEALDQKFLGSRRSRMNMTPAEKRADRTGAADSVVAEGKRAFDEGFVDFVFHPLKKFATMRNLPVDSTDVAAIENYMKVHMRGMSVVTDTSGVRGVEVPDMDGGSYRIRRGTSTYADKRARERIEDDAEAEEVYSGMADKLAMVQGHEVAHVEAEEERARKHRREDPRSCRAGFSLTEAPGDLPTPRVVAASVGGRRCRLDASPVESAAGASSQDGHSVVEDASEGESTRAPESRKRARSTGGGLVDPKTGPDKKKRRTAAEKATSDASVLYDATAVSHDWQGQWNLRSRRREFDALVTRLRSAARRCSQIPVDRVASDLADKGYNLAEKLEQRQALEISGDSPTALGVARFTQCSRSAGVPPDLSRGAHPRMVGSGCFWPGPAASAHCPVHRGSVRGDPERVPGHHEEAVGVG